MKSNIVNIISRILFSITLTAVTVLAVVPNYDALPPIVSFSDLLNHAVAFFVLFLMLRCAYTDIETGKAFLLLLGYALLIEAIQYFLPTRFASFSDVVADAAGMFLAMLLQPLFKRVCPRLHFLKSFK